MAQPKDPRHTRILLSGRTLQGLPDYLLEAEGKHHTSWGKVKFSTKHCLSLLAQRADINNSAVLLTFSRRCVYRSWVSLMRSKLPPEELSAGSSRNALSFPKAIRFFTPVIDQCSKVNF